MLLLFSESDSLLIYISTTPKGTPLEEVHEDIK